LKKFPPQVASRNAAATWACHVHNQVNARLGKEAFDCSKIGDFYDCGCGSEEDEGGKAKGKEGSTKVDGEKGEVVKEKPREVQKEAGGVVSEKTRKKEEHFTPLQLEKEGMTRGG
jgi:FAD-linked sulfhydryl oxidase